MINSNWLAPEKIPRLVIDAEKRAALHEGFKQAREVLSCWESKLQKNEQKRKEWLLVEFPTSLERIQWMEFCLKVPPLLHVLLQMENVAVTRGIKHITKAIELDLNTLDHRCSAWLFALLARLDTPFTDDVAWTLKKLLRLSVGSISSNSSEEDDSIELKPAIVIQCLVEDFFGQADFSN